MNKGDLGRDDPSVAREVLNMSWGSSP